MPDRMGPLRTVLGRFVASVNNTRGPGSAVSVLASDAGLDQVSLSPFEAAPTVSGLAADRVRLLIPGGTKGPAGVAPSQVMALVSPTALESDSVTYTGEEPGALVRFPTFVPQATIDPSKEFNPGQYYLSDAQSTDQVFVPRWRELSDRIGMDGLPEGAKRVEPGGTVETANTAFAGPADVLFDSTGRYQFSSDIFDKGVQLPLGGATFGLAALSTPNASVGGKTLNPLVGEKTKAVLQREAARRMLKRAGVTDAGRVEWLAGPSRINDGPQVDLAGEQTTLETFGSVVSGDAGPWGVWLHVARSTPGDHVIAAAVHRRPVGTPEGGMERVMESGRTKYNNIARKFAAETMSALKPVNEY